MLFIGFYNASVILTYIGLASAVFGIFQAFEGNFMVAVFCQLIAGVCDMFDGKIARAMKRTDDEKVFGIQIDSLCDLICFGVFPAVFAYCIGVKSTVGMIILIYYVLAAVIRLGYFNVTEQTRQQQTSENRKMYQGLPVTSAALLIPIMYLVTLLVDGIIVPFFTCGMLLIGILFIANIKVKKPGNKFAFILIALGAIVAGLYIYVLIR